MTAHVTTVRKGVVGPGEPGHRVFESNFVIECTCGTHMGCATLSARKAESWRADHVDRHARRGEVQS